MKKKIPILLIVCSFISTIHAQEGQNEDFLAYIGQYKSLAIQEMKLYHIPASITLAQGMIESGCGKSELALKSNNHFGIKCHKEWNGDTFFYDDDQKNECFRKYPTVEESYRDHSLFLVSRTRYALLFSIPITDYKSWANGLKQAGYATNPAYATILIKNIELYKLYLLDDTLLSNAEPYAEAVQEPVVQVQPKPEIYVDIQAGNRLLFRKNYQMPDKQSFQYLFTSDKGRKVYQNNGIPFVFAYEDDTWFSLAEEFNIYAFQIYKQNDLLKNDPIVKGQMLYLEPKKRKNPAKTYILKKEDCLYSVSQLFGIKLKMLLKYNHLRNDEEPISGTTIKLSR